MLIGIKYDHFMMMHLHPSPLKQQMKLILNLLRLTSELVVVIMLYFRENCVTLQCWENESNDRSWS